MAAVNFAAGLLTSDDRSLPSVCSKRIKTVVAKQATSYPHLGRIDLNIRGDVLRNPHI